MTTATRTPLPASDFPATTRSNSQLPFGSGFMADTFLWEWTGGYNPYTYEGSLRERTICALTGSR